MIRLAACVLFLMGTVALAQESKPVPPREIYMPFCMKSARTSEPNGVFGSSVDRALAKAQCSCKFAQLSKLPGMTKDQYISAALFCIKAQRRDFDSFVQTYLK